MYWVYLTLFVLIIFTPQIISNGVLFFREEDLESIVIFCFGLIGLILYLGKESALMRAIRDKLSLQKESNQIRKDLVQSYSYIGEMNRHLEILKQMIVESPHTVQELMHGERGRVYESVFEAALLLAQSDAVALIFADVTTGNQIAFYHTGTERERFSSLDTKALLATKKYWWQQDGLACVRSSEETRGVTALLIFRALKNRVEETGIFQILVTHALLLFSLHDVHQSKERLL